jgi:hypothetical protein
MRCVVQCCRREAGRSSQRRKKTVLVLYGNPLPVPTIRTTDQGLMAGLSPEQKEEVEIF